jgi:hypothetical protein
MKKYLFLLMLMVLAVTSLSAKKVKVIKVSVEPAEAAVYVNNNFMGYGYAEFTRPRWGEVAIIKCELNEYKTIQTKFYWDDKRKDLTLKMQQDGFYRASAASGVVNKYFTIALDQAYYTMENGKVDASLAWKMVHQILLNYFEEIETTDMYGGYLQTPWQYKTFNISEKQIRNRVTIRDISTPAKAAFQIKISSEIAGAMAAKHGEFTEVDRIPKELEPLIEELQTRIGKVSSL